MVLNVNRKYVEDFFDKSLEKTFRTEAEKALDTVLSGNGD